MSTKELIANKVRPENSKPLYQRLIERSENKTFCYENGMILCEIRNILIYDNGIIISQIENTSRIFAFNTTDTFVQMRWFDSQPGLHQSNHDDWDKAEIGIIDTPAFCEKLFFENINEVYEITE